MSARRARPLRLRPLARGLAGALCLALAAAATAGCGDATPAVSPGMPPERPAEVSAPETTLRRARVRVGMQVIRAEVADTFEARARGLSGRRQLPEGHGMLFVYARAARHGFWMPDMHFDLDIVWIRDGRIVDVTADIPHEPPADGELPVYRPDEPASLVLEVPAGTAARHGWAPGHEVEVERLPAPDDA